MGGLATRSVFENNFLYQQKHIETFKDSPTKNFSDFKAFTMKYLLLGKLKALLKHETAKVKYFQKFNGIVKTFSSRNLATVEGRSKADLLS